ncbi:type II toxin-antitoxin system VapC family toxin [Streptomyces sp. B21-083]|uniref:type II toxin-antitoxin system VapC family toxin n=1 Tax=Streptomyces sp. B21-083 TaxID=3039410 RepID=UPI002FEEAB0A
MDTGTVRAHFLPDALCAPAHLDFEVAKVIRRLYVRRELTEERAGAAMEALTELPIRRIPLADLLPRVWELRDNAYTGDALYLALAEELGCPLVTTDSKLVGVPGHHANVETLT